MVRYRLLTSVVAVPAPSRRKEVSDTNAVVDHLAIHEHPLVLGFLFVAQGVASCFFPFMKTETKLSHSS